MLHMLKYRATKAIRDESAASAEAQGKSIDVENGADQTRVDVEGSSEDNELAVGGN